MLNVEHWLQNDLNTAIDTTEPLAGGDICETLRLTTTDGRTLCVKLEPTAPDDFFIAEAAGLDALREAGGVRVPEVHRAQPGFIAMEYIAPGRPGPDYWRDLGEGLARQHRRPVPHFGFTLDNYCGRTPQPNPATERGHDFFAEHRLMHQGRLAESRGLLTAAELERLEALCRRLPELIPEQPPGLIHGDLWGGNLHCDREGHPVLIDPGAHWGWPEAEIAMTRLFGGFAPAFYEHYLSVNPLEPGWENRVPLYNLYHLLNHLNLFGSGYHSSVIQTLKRFS